MRPGLQRGIAVVLWLTFAGCESTPVPADKQEFIGLWVASDRFISVFANGRIEYKEKLRLGFHNRVESGAEFKGNKIEAMLSEYTIDEPPHQVDGVWRMTMDGVEYVRRGPPVVYGKSNNWPEGIE